MASGDQPDDGSAEEEEARRWQPLVGAFLDQVPEIRTALEARWDYEDGRRWGPGDVWTTAVEELLDHDDYPVGLATDVWRRLLALLEVVEDLNELLEIELGELHEDAVTTNAFENAGILCEVTRNQAGLQALLPLMEPKTVEGARAEVMAHRRREADWSVGSREFEPLSTVTAAQLHPLEA